MILPDLAQLLPLAAMLVVIGALAGVIAGLLGVGGGLHLADLTHVGLNREHLDALLLADLLGRLIESFLAAREDDEVHALLREATGDRPADALAGAGDQSGSAFKSEVHPAFRRARLQPRRERHP